MTLILAIKARDGVVMAADGQEVVDTGSGAIRAQVDKIHRLGRSAAWGGSGEVTFVQRARRALELCAAKRGAGKFSLPADIELVSDAIIDVAARLLEQTNVTAAPEEREARTDDREDVPAGELLLADYRKGEGRIYQIDSRGFEAEIDARFAAIGLADVAAYSLLRPFTDSDLAAMSVEEATLLAYGMLCDALELSAEVGPPVQVWVVDRSGPRRVVKTGTGSVEEQRLEQAWRAYGQDCKARFFAAVGAKA